MKPYTDCVGVWQWSRGSHPRIGIQLQWWRPRSR